MKNINDNPEYYDIGIMSIKLNSTCLKNPYFLLLALSVFGLLFAYFVEYIMGLAACPLCIYQRFPYLIFIMLSIISLSGGGQSYNKYYIIITLVAIMLAAYHTSIELGIFEPSALCKPLVSIDADFSVSDFKKMLYSQKIGTCSKPALVIFGLSMTVWNLLLNVVLLPIFIKYRNYEYK